MSLRRSMEEHARIDEFRRARILLPSWATRDNHQGRRYIQMVTAGATIKVGHCPKNNPDGALLCFIFYVKIWADGWMGARRANKKRDPLRIEMGWK